MDNDNKTVVRPKLKTMLSVSIATTIRDRTARRKAAARKAYRAKIESLLDESSDEQLADVWQRVCPFPIDPAYDLPDRREIVLDLADLAVVLRPSLDGMQANQLCRLIEKHAAYEPRQPDLAASLLA